MHWKNFSEKTSEYPIVQKIVEDVLSTIIETFFKDSGEYVQEKMVKLFCEPVRLLEKLLQYQNEIHHSQKIELKIPADIVKLIIKQEEIVRKLTCEIHRQTRFLCLILTNISPVEMKENIKTNHYKEICYSNKSKGGSTL